MSDLTEAEIFDRLRSSLREVIQGCVNLAEWPSQGPTYIQLRKDLALVEGASRQAGHWRRDARWFALGWEVAAFQQRIGDALRCHAPRKVFLGMADFFRKALHEADKLKVAKTGRRGPIMPTPKPGPHRESRPVYVQRPSGLILPSVH
jgi:hypothetical protein